MKILIFSDTHGDEDAFNQMIDYEKNVDEIYCMGDSGFHIDFLKEHKVESVKGNYPFAPKLPMTIKKNIKGYSFYFTHGHRYHVKYGLSKLIQKADLLKMDVCCFGHTHKALLKKTQALILLNPGALSYTRSHLFPSYARLFLETNKIIIELINLQTKEVVDKYTEVN